MTASTYSKDKSSHQKAKALLLKALDMNEFYIKAVLMLVDFLKSDNEFRAAIKLLEKTCVSVVIFKMHFSSLLIVTKNNFIFQDKCETVPGTC